MIDENKDQDAADQQKGGRTRAGLAHGRAASSIKSPSDIEGTSIPLSPLGDRVNDDRMLPDAVSKPYSAFSNQEKWGIIVLISSASIFSPISTSIYTPAIPTLADAFGVSVVKINLTLTVYLIFQALTPSIWGAASDSYGRRPIFIVNLALYMLSCIGTALCPTNAFWLLMVLRIVQAAGGSATIALGSGVIADIASPHERGKFLGAFQFAGTFSTAIGPVLGGVFAGTLGWRSIFWFLTIFCGLVLVPVIFLLPETLRSLVADGSIPPPLINCTPRAYIRRRQEKRLATTEGRTSKVVDRPDRTPFRPMASFRLLFKPDVGMMFLWSAIGYALWYALITVFSTLLKDQYGLNDIIIGVCYVPNGVGTAISAITAGRLMDRAYRAEKKRVGADHREKPDEFRLERTRFIFLPFQAGLTMASCLIVGWTMEVRANLAVPVIFSFFVGLGTSFLATATIYGIDLHPGQGGAVTASFNLIRCAAGAVSVAVIQVLNRHIGSGWSFVLLCGIWLVFTPLPLVLGRYGVRWRQKRTMVTSSRPDDIGATQTTPAASTSTGPPKTAA